MEATAARLDECDNRGEMAANLRARKLNNTRTSIVLGSDALAYETDAMSRQKDAVGKMSTIDRSGARELKKQLTMSHFSTNLEGLPGEFSTSAKAAIGPEEERYGQSIDRYRGQLDAKAAKLTRASSVSFGSGPPNDYSTTMDSSLKFVVGSITEGDRRAASTTDAKRLKFELSRQHFSFAHPNGTPEEDAAQEAGRFTTTSARFAYDPRSSTAPPHVKAASCKADTLADSVKLGNERVHYASTTHDALAVMATGITAEARQRAIDEQRDNRTRIAELKKALLKTSVVIGADDEYY